MPSSSEDAAAVLRGAARAVEVDAGVQGRLVPFLAQELIARDPACAPLVVPPSAARGGSAELVRLEAQAFARVRKRPTTERISLACAAQELLATVDPEARGALARALADRLRASATESAASRRARDPVARGACFLLALSFLIGTLVCAGLVALGARSARPLVEDALDVPPKSPPLVPESRLEREAVALGVLRTLAAAQVLARDEDRGSENSRYGTLVELAALAHLELGRDGRRDGYRFSLAPSTTAPDERFWAMATPDSPDTGSRFFFTDQTGVVLAATAPFIIEDRETCEFTKPGPSPAPPPLPGEPDRARAFAAAGTAALYESRWLDALAPLETSVELGPESVEAWTNLGKAYLELGSRDMKTRADQLETNVLLARAEAALLRAVALARAGSPSLPSCENDLGLVFLRRGEDLMRLPSQRVERDRRKRELAREAGRHFERALALEPSNESARIDAAAARLREADQADPDERRRLGQQAVELLEASESVRREKPNLSPRGASGAGPSGPSVRWRPFASRNWRVALTNLGFAYRAADRPRDAVKVLAPVVEAETGPAGDAAATALRDQALGLAKSLERPLAPDDEALLRRVARLLASRQRPADRDAAADLDALLARDRSY
jgi:tetratricopeptide (TPR) repeat protein